MKLAALVALPARRVVLAAGLVAAAAGLSIATASRAVAQDTAEAAADQAPPRTGELCTPRSSEGAVVEGSLRERSSGLLLGGAEVLVTVLPPPDSGSVLERSVTADALGQYRFCDLPAGRSARVTARYGGTMAALRMIDLRAGDTTRVELSITAGRLAHVLAWVRDADGEPVERAMVRLEPGNRAVVTDEHGRFVLPSVGPGTYTLIVQDGEAGPRRADLEIEPGAGLELEVTLPPADSAGGRLDVSAETRPRYLMRTGFYERMRLANGHFLEPEQVEARRGSSMGQLLRALPSVRAPNCRGADCRATPTTSEGCRMSIWVDGQRIRSGGLATVRVDNLLAVEAYRRRTTTPEPFQDPFGSCGSLVLWTRV